MSNSAGPHELRIQLALAQIHRKSGAYSAKAPPTPAEEAMSAEEALGDDAYGDRAAGVNAFLDWLMRVGPDPRPVMHRLYTYLISVRGDLVLNMKSSDLALLFNQTRAAQQAREKKLFGEAQKAAGYRSLEMPHQKSEASRKKCSRAQRGNRHRAQSVRAAA